MDRLWAPWRISYVQGKKHNKCIFCAGARSPGKKNHVILKTKYSLTLLNLFPYNNGHLMVAPLRHVGRLNRLKDHEAMDLFKAVIKVQKLLDKVLRPQGYNIGINLSDVAGAGIPGHLHIHIVPRWKGDTNFMPVLSDTKIISQSLDELYSRLKKAAYSL